MAYTSFRLMRLISKNIQNFGILTYLDYYLTLPVCLLFSFIATSSELISCTKMTLFIISSIPRIEYFFECLRTFAALSYIWADNEIWRKLLCKSRWPTLLVVQTRRICRKFLFNRLICFCYIQMDFAEIINARPYFKSSLC